MNRLLILLFASLALASAATPPPQPVAFRVGPLRFERPESWKWVPPSGSFRAAQLERKSSDGTLLTLTFSRFPAGDGGTPQANLSRWTAQFSSSTPSQPDIQKGPAGTLTFYRLEGTLRGGTPGGPTRELPQALLLGAILESQGEQIIMKLVGPARSVAPAEKDFLLLATQALGLTP